MSGGLKGCWRQVRVADFVAEALEKEADRIPASMRDQAESLRNIAKRLRESDNLSLVRVHEVPPASQSKRP
jgi:hypothetical protein